MSTVPPGAPGVAVHGLSHGPEQIRLYGHTTLFYWWPVWALGFVLTVISLIDDTRILHVPGGTAVAKINETRYEIVNSNRPRELDERLERYLPGENQWHPPRLSH